MPTLNEYAQLADRVYQRTVSNRTPIPSGWTELLYDTQDPLSGFSSGVFQNGNDIVIAYTGTNEGKVRDFAIANAPAALGTPSAQVTEAMMLYCEVKRDHPTANITFTGHSLGADLASLMAVYFDRPATVFDEAPFKLSARNVSTLGFYQIELAKRGFSDPAFNTYALGLGSAFTQRESQRGL